MRVLVTGGAGFIGGYVVERLEGHQIVVLDSLSPQIHGDDPWNGPLLARVHDRCTFMHGSVLDADLLAGALDGVDHVIHLAAETGTGQSMYRLRRYAAVNVQGLATLLELIQRGHGQVRGLTLASSRSVYGEGAYACPAHGTVFPGPRSAPDLRAGDFEPHCPVCHGMVTMVPTCEDSPLSPSSFYALTKRVQEDMVMQVCPALGVDWTILRYQNVYGPGQSLQNPYTGILAVFSRLLLAGEPLNIFEDGLEARDFVHVQDVADVTVAAVRTRAAFGRVVNVGTGHSTSVLEAAEALRTAYASASRLMVSGDFRVGDIRSVVADLSLATRIFGVRDWISFTEGVQSFAAWVRASSADLATQRVTLDESLLEMERAGLLTRGSGS